MLHVDYYDYFYIRQSHHELTIGHVTLQRTAPEIVALWSAICVMEMCACVTAVGGLYSYTYIYRVIRSAPVEFTWFVRFRASSIKSASIETAFESKFSEQTAGDERTNHTKGKTKKISHTQILKRIACNVIDVVCCKV